LTKVRQYHEQDDLTLNDSEIESIVKEVLSFKKIKCDEIILHFVTVERITELHGQFFNDPTPTDCITFPIASTDTQEDIILGEIFVSPKAATEYSPQNPHWEIALYIVHGILHLLGYDDIEEEDRNKMREAESEIMTHLEKKMLVNSIGKVFDKS